MNEIEERFFDEYVDYCCQSGDSVDMLTPQAVVGVYRVDFLYGHCAIEIDGHEFHKTKEQRFKDYTKDRFLIKEGYIPVRFMGTEVFLDAAACVATMIEIDGILESRDATNFMYGRESGKRQAAREAGELNGTTKKTDG